MSDPSSERGPTSADQAAFDAFDKRVLLWALAGSAGLALASFGFAAASHHASSFLSVFASAVAVAAAARTDGWLRSRSASQRPQSLATTFAHHRVTHRPSRRNRGWGPQSLGRQPRYRWTDQAEHEARQPKGGKDYDTPAEVVEG